MMSSFGSAGHSRLHELHVEALSPEEWNYIRGLYLSDGSASISHVKNGGRKYRVSFCLQGNEEKIVEKLVEMLRRAGMNPWVMFPSRTYQIVVEMVSKVLFGFFPRKDTLKHSVEMRERFFDENSLHSLDNGIPFLAGLLDGDGTLKVYVEKGRTSGAGFLGDVAQWTWSFTQRRYPFLAQYVKEFVNSLVSDSAQIYKCSNGTLLVPIRKPGAEALLHAGIAKYSWKVVNWLEMVAKVRGERKEFYTTKKIANMFHVSVPTVIGWIESGRMSCRRGTKHFARRYVHAEEVERFKKHFQEVEDRAHRIRAEGAVTIPEASRLLGVREATIKNWCYVRWIRAERVREPRGQRWRSLLISRGEVERIRRKLRSEVEEIDRASRQGLELVDAARTVHVVPQTLRKWCRQGKVTATTITDRKGRSRRCRIISKEEIERLLNERRNIPDKGMKIVKNKESKLSSD
jgi:transposase